MTLNEEQILALAPDDASQKAGKDLSGPAKWVTRGSDESAVWGECKGSGSKPYQSQVDLNALAFKCTCPSRKFPCKHGLGLLLFCFKYPAEFTDNQQPAWVSEWLGKRADKENKKAEKEYAPEKPIDEAAQKKRLDARISKINDGIDELLLWIKDIVRSGIMSAPEKGHAFWLNMGKRMVDAQAGGLAGLVNELAGINYFKEGWQTQFLNQLLTIYQIAKGYQNIDSLPDGLQADVKSLIGFNLKIEEVKTQPEIRDNWMVVGRQAEDDGPLTTERNWLIGTKTGRKALILNFYVRNQPKDISLAPGTTIDAGLAFYPSTTPLRAILMQQHSIVPNGQLTGCADWAEVMDFQTDILTENPFIGALPFVIEGVRPVRSNENWWLQDRNNNVMALQLKEDTIWTLTSLSGGEFLPMAVVGREYDYMPLGVWINGKYKLL